MLQQCGYYELPIHEVVYEQGSQIEMNMINVLPLRISNGRGAIARVE